MSSPNDAASEKAISQWTYLAYSARYLVRWALYAVLIGAVVGVVSFAFEWTLFELHALTSRWWLWGMPVLGGLLVAVVIRHERRAASDGIQVYIDGVSTEGGWLDKWLLPLKFIATVFTMGTGGSGGRVGPMVLMGGSVGSWASRLSGRRRAADHPTAAMCGAAAALGALLHCPLGGGIFAAEVLYPNSIRYHGLFPAILSSTVGYIVRTQFLPVVWDWSVPPHVFALNQVGPIFLVAAVTGLVGLGFTLLYRWVESRLRALREIAWLVPAMGALAVVAIGWLTMAAGAEGTEIMGPGGDLFSRIVSPAAWTGAAARMPIGLWLALVLLAGKTLATVATVGSGGSGGLFFPSLLIGGLIGCGFADALSAADALRLGIIAAGMAASLASVVNVPIAAAVILIEMFGTGFTVPILIGAAAGFIIGRPAVIYHYGRYEQPSSAEPLH